MALQLLDSTRTSDTESIDSSEPLLLNTDPKAVKTPKNSVNLGEASTTEKKESQKTSEKISKIQKSTLRKIKDWFTRAYRISQIAKKKPERVRSVGKHILILGMLIGAGPSFISTLTRNFKTNKDPERKRPTQKKLEKTKASKKKSERLVRVVETSEVKGEPVDPITVNTNNQIYVLVSNTGDVIETEEIYYSIGNESVVQITIPLLESTTRETHTLQSPENDSLIVEATSNQTALINSDMFVSYTSSESKSAVVPEAQIIESKTGKEERRNLNISGDAEGLWKDQEIQLTLYPNFRKEVSNVEKDSSEFDWSLQTERERLHESDLNISLPVINLIRQITYEYEDVLPLEIAYEMALKLIIRTVTEAKGLFRRESNVDMSETKKDPHISFETGIEDFISGSNARLRLGLRRIQLKAEVDIEVPWEDGDLELEAIAKLKPFNEMPLDRLRFQLNYEHPVLGGNCELRGWLDFEPDEQNPYTIGVRARFNRVIFNNAHLGAEAFAVKEIGGEYDLGVSFGFQFTWGPGAKREVQDPYEGMNDVERKLRRKLDATKILTRASLRAQRAYEDGSQR
jgi:hypothetical protein